MTGGAGRDSTIHFRRAFRVVASLFFMWGFITVMNDILNNTVKDVFDLRPVERALIQFTFFGAFFIVSLIYFIWSALGKDPINRIGYHRGMVGSLIICALGCYLFYPAALLVSYPAFLAALFILASGVTLLQICANPYAAILGPPEAATGRLNLAQGLNSLGTTLAPIFGLLLIYRVFSRGEATVDSISQSYLVFGTMFLLLAVLVALAKMPSFQNTEDQVSLRHLFSQKHLIRGVIAIFLYVGAEVSAGNWLADFLVFTSQSPLTLEEAGEYLSYFWGGLMIGRIMAAFAFNPECSPVLRNLAMPLSAIALFMLIYLVTGLHIDESGWHFAPADPKTVAPFPAMMILQLIAFRLGRQNPAGSLMVFCMVNLTLLCLALFAPPLVAFWALVGTGLFFSIGWSTIFTLAIRGLGSSTSRGSSLLVMAIAGGAVLPLAQAWLYESAGWGIRHSFLVPTLAVALLIGYGFMEYRALKRTVDSSS